MSAPSPSADRNLLFGLLALQMDFLSRDQLLEAMLAWMLEKQTPLGEILCRRGVLAQDDRADIERLVDKHVRRHGNDPRASLAVVRVDPDVRASLAALDDADVQASLAPATSASVADSVHLIVPSYAVRDDGSAGGVRYSKLRSHARGGLGEVYVARDEELHREVALKEIQERFADHADSRSRFVREAEITGHLEHPGVVPVYGLGAYTDGRPYYAMRLIRGESMQEAIERFHQADENPRWDVGERSLALRELLSRFVAICHTVGYAHARGVIHRDLKPANVMLGEYGETLVVDWGLARLFDSSDGERTVAERPIVTGVARNETQTGHVVGTPAYMPPEQARGKQDQVGPASDVFALGATLYCLLTGKSPYGGTDALTQAAMVEFVPARQRKHSVPTALEAVCGKAMAKQPEERYPTARALAEDVQRWLADEPVRAYREPLTDRTRRLARRHRAWVAASLLVLLLGVIGLSLGLWAVSNEQAKTAWQRDQAKDNLQRAQAAEAEAKNNLKQAEANLELARTAVDECFGVARYHPTLQWRGFNEVKTLLLEKTLPFYAKFRQQRPGDDALAGQQAEYLFRVALIAAQLGRDREAVEKYEQVCPILADLGKARPDVLLYRVNLGAAWKNLGGSLSRLGKVKDALRCYDEAITIRTQLTKDYPKKAEFHAVLAGTHRAVADLHWTTEQPLLAIRSEERARQILESLIQAHPEKVEYRAELATTCVDLGGKQAREDQTRAALRSLEQGRGLLTELNKAHPGVLRYQNELAGACANLGEVQRRLGKTREALRAHEQARDIQSELARGYPEQPEYRFVLATIYNNLGVVQMGAGHHEEALRNFEQARRIQLALTSAFPSRSKYRAELAGTEKNLGLLSSKVNKPEDALKHFLKERDLLLELAKAHPEVARYRDDLALAWTATGIHQEMTGRKDEALRSHQQARAIWLALTQADSSAMSYRINLAGACCNVGHWLRDAGKPGDSLALFAQAIELLQDVQQRQPGNLTAKHFLLNSHWGRAQALTRLGRYHEADTDWDRARSLAPIAQQLGLRVSRADSLARAGDYRRATAEVHEMGRGWFLTGVVLYRLASVQAVNTASAAQDTSRPLPQREKRAEHYARAAVELLGRAAAAGYFRDPKRVEHLDGDDDLAGLRDRDDYRAFRKTLAAKPAAPR